MTYEIFHAGQASQILEIDDKKVIKIVNNVFLPHHERRCSQGWQAELIDSEGPAFNVNHLINQHNGPKQIAALFGM